MDFFSFSFRQDPTPPKLIVSNYNSIISMDLASRSYDVLVRWENPNAVDWDIADDLLFWSDYRDNAIYSFNGTTSRQVSYAIVYRIRDE